MEDQEIIDLFWQRSEEAIAQTHRKYGRYCHTIAHNILQNDCDSDECVNDTYMKVWSIIPPRRPSLFSALLGKITRNLALDRYKYNRAEKRGGGQVALALEELAECIPGGKSEDEYLENRVLTELLNRFLSSLPRQNREIFMLRYWYLCSVRQIADSLGLSDSNVKMTLLRSRRQLKTLLEKEGVCL
ncbi:MAG: RNA polymerase sigma factor [Faecousia sp.]